MKSQEVKVAILEELVYGSYLAAVTEYCGADVYGITQSLYSHEIEVKVSKADLMSELYAIKEVLDDDSSYMKRSKGHKHYYYLKRPGNILSQFYRPPNRFSFAVPNDLVEIARQYLKDTPYGLYEMHDAGANYITRRIVKKASWLQRTKVTQEDIYKIISKCSLEVVSLRRKLLDLDLNSK